MVDIVTVEGLELDFVNSRSVPGFRIYWKKFRCPRKGLETGRSLNYLNYSDDK